MFLSGLDFVLVPQFPAGAWFHADVPYPWYWWWVDQYSLAYVGSIGRLKKSDFVKRHRLKQSSNRAGYRSRETTACKNCSTPPAPLFFFFKQFIPPLEGDLMSSFREIITQAGFCFLRAVISIFIESTGFATEFLLANSVFFVKYGNSCSMNQNTTRFESIQ